MIKTLSLGLFTFLALFCLPLVADDIGYRDSFKQANNSVLHARSNKAKRTIYVDTQLTKESSTKVKSLLTIDLQDGDQILLKGGQRHRGTIEIVGKKNITIGTYGKEKAILDCSGYPQGILLENSSSVHIHDLNITGEGAAMLRSTDADKTYRYGIYLNANNGLVADVEIENVNIKKLYYYQANDPALPKHGRACRQWSTNELEHYSFGIRGTSSAWGNNKAEAGMRQITLRNCHIEDVSRTGIQINGSPKAPITNLLVTECSIKNVGGPGLQFSQVQGGVLSRTLTYRSGSSDDKRKWGRGSGIWTHSCDDFLMEYCRFERAEGIADCCGAHIDIGNSNVVIQYCFSKDNAGGFIEILGKNQNCAYRYNVSLNDGWRNTKDPKQEDVWRDMSLEKGSKILGTAGCLLTINGHTNDDYVGPYHSYIYNNTIVCDEKRSDGYQNPMIFEVATSTVGTLIMNNIFWIPAPMNKGWSQHAIKEGKFVNNAVDFRITSGELNEKGRPLVRDMNEAELDLMNLVLRNNLYQLYDPKSPMGENLLPHNEDIAESSLRYRDSKALGGDPRWLKSKNWQNPSDFIPRNAKLIAQGMNIKKLKGDPSKTGLKPQLELRHDFYGRPLKSPILGAIKAEPFKP